MLATGHLWADFLQGAVPALLPFLIAERGYSYAAAGALVLASSIGSSLIQPLFGVVSDRLGLPWLMPAGLAIGGAGLACVGLTETYPATVAAVAVSGLGVAAFHPEARALRELRLARAARAGDEHVLARVAMRASRSVRCW